jgi:hypothetical protein
MVIERVCINCKSQSKVKLNPNNNNAKVIGFTCQKCDTVNKLNNPFYAEVQDENYTCITNMTIVKDLQLALEVYDEKGRYIEKKDITSGVNLIGRKIQTGLKDSFIFINDASVSKAHCSILLETVSGRVRFVLQDLNSSNGSFVNGRKINPTTQILLQPNDIISIGNTHLKSVFKINENDQE